MAYRTKTNTQNKFLALLLSVIFVCVIFFSTFYIVREAQHDCTGEDCPICAHIHQAQQNIKQIGSGVTTAANDTAVAMPAILALSCILLFISCTTLVSQKVRLND